MHDRNETAKRAREILKACGIDICTAFEALAERQIDALLAHLDQHRFNKYGPMSKLRQPPGGVNSRVRSFHGLLQHRAALRQPQASASRQS
ncbi:hypothetical protein FJV83_30045 [Mesorhizobium sp. WSM4307]|uniref:hypothetical protein n=1 Tax=unclassified Mesorhizobium TaxID=325217 RepID=UPI00115E7CAE|nr:MULTISPECIES: hypothetical protein [unclassified Mesorhizobium]TRC75271.1 hypothetical protein FJV80_28260 [Mesorhizobium sp. WSM4310]TRC77922.1 hypothetical protein FJV81_09855 [Mesorhizobium sp. WSM4315]TRC78684.1 hypothetical protein FJV83_30045 [Mesorhizobium sp. WSM4307]TRC95933.1 hypothetical protein FJV82_27590 [Mesorhizobium sp. WSM4305]